MSGDSNALKDCWRNGILDNSSQVHTQNDESDKPEERDNTLDKLSLQHGSLWIASTEQLKQQDIRTQYKSVNQSECTLGTQLTTDNVFSNIPVETVLKETEGEVVVSPSDSESVLKGKNQSHCPSPCSSTSALDISIEGESVKDFWQGHISECNCAETLHTHFDCRAKQKQNIQQKRQDPMYKEQERLRQRNMMQMKRQDPLFRALEREKERFRMRARRLDPIFRAQERERQRRRMQMKRQDPAFRERERQRQKSRMQVKRQNPSYKEQERVRDRLRMRIRRQIDGYKILTSKEDNVIQNSAARNNSCIAHNLKESCSCESCSTTVLNLDHNTTVSNIGISANRIFLKESIESLSQKDDRGKTDSDTLNYNSHYPLLFNFYSSGKDVTTNTPHVSTKNSQKTSPLVKSTGSNSLCMPAFPTRHPLPLQPDSIAPVDKVTSLMTGHLPFPPHNSTKSSYLSSESDSGLCLRDNNGMQKNIRDACEVQQTSGGETCSSEGCGIHTTTTTTTTTITTVHSCSPDVCMIERNTTPENCLSGVNGFPRSTVVNLPPNIHKSHRVPVSATSQLCDISGSQKNNTEMCRIAVPDTLSWTHLWTSQSALCECSRCKSLPKLDMQFHVHYKENLRHTQENNGCGTSVLKHDLKSSIERPYLCNQCGAQLQTMSGLRYHEQTHSSELAFRCDACGKAYNNKGNLVRHLKLHTERHHCDLCGKVFHMKQHLKEHMRSHGDKNLSCPHCEYKTCYKYALNRHLATKHSSENLQHCSCGLQFKSQNLLHRHQMICRNVQLDQIPVAVVSIGH